MKEEEGIHEDRSNVHEQEEEAKESKGTTTSSNHPQGSSEDDIEIDPALLLKEQRLIMPVEMMPVPFTSSTSAEEIEKDNRGSSIDPSLLLHGLDHHHQLGGNYIKHTYIRFRPF